MIANIESDNMKLDAMPSNEVVLFEQVPNQDDPNDLIVNNLVLFDAGADKENGVDPHVVCNGADFFITGPLPASLDEDEVTIDHFEIMQFVI